MNLKDQFDIEVRRVQEPADALQKLCPFIEMFLVMGFTPVEGQPQKAEKLVDGNCYTLHFGVTQIEGKPRGTLELVGDKQAGNKGLRLCVDAAGSNYKVAELVPRFIGGHKEVDAKDYTDITRATQKIRTLLEDIIVKKPAPKPLPTQKSLFVQDAQTRHVTTPPVQEPPPAAEVPVDSLLPPQERQPYIPKNYLLGKSVTRAGVSEEQRAARPPILSHKSSPTRSSGGTVAPVVQQPHEQQPQPPAAPPPQP